MAAAAGAKPAFDEPWQAEAFAIANLLRERGHFSAAEWAQALGRELAEAAARGEPDDGSHYYDHWLAALERLVADKGILTAERLAARKEEWRAAAAATPHGQPIELPQQPGT